MIEQRKKVHCFHWLQAATISVIDACSSRRQNVGRALSTYLLVCPFPFVFLRSRVEASIHLDSSKKFEVEGLLRYLRTLCIHQLTLGSTESYCGPLSSLITLKISWPSSIVSSQYHIYYYCLFELLRYET